MQNFGILFSGNIQVQQQEPNFASMNRLQGFQISFKKVIRPSMHWKTLSFRWQQMYVGKIFPILHSNMF